MKSSVMSITDGECTSFAGIWRHPLFAPWSRRGEYRLGISLEARRRDTDEPARGTSTACSWAVGARECDLTGGADVLSLCKPLDYGEVWIARGHEGEPSG